MNRMQLVSPRGRMLKLLLLVFVLVGFAPALHAATITVKTADDIISGGGPCSLYKAIQNANQDTTAYPECAPDQGSGGYGADTIKFSVPQVNVTLGAINIVNLSGNPNIQRSDITIQG